MMDSFLVALFFARPLGLLELTGGVKFFHLTSEAIHPNGVHMCLHGVHDEKNVRKVMYMHGLNLQCTASLVPRPPHSFCRLQYEKHGEPGNEANVQLYHAGGVTTKDNQSLVIHAYDVIPFFVLLVFGSKTCLELSHRAHEFSILLGAGHKGQI